MITADSKGHYVTVEGHMKCMMCDAESKRPQSGVDQGRHGGSTETPRKTEETVQATQQGIHRKGTSTGLLWARRFFDASSEEKPRVFDKVTVVLQQRCMSAKQDGWVGRDLGEAAR